MAHTIREKSELIQRVRRIRGQMEALERALETEQECAQVLQLIAAARGAMNSLMGEVLEGQIRSHVLHREPKRGSERAETVEQLIGLVRSYLR